MSKRAALVAVLALAALAALPQDAAAAHDRFYVASQFRVGGVGISLIVPFGADLQRPGRYYYRTPHRLSYRGVGCGRACFTRAGYNYHSHDCPVVGHHFDRHRFHPGWRGDRGHVGDRDWSDDGRHDRDRDRNWRHDRRSDRRPAHGRAWGRHRHDDQCGHRGDRHWDD